ncbi:MAG: hypothetical protein ACYC3X_25750 [Pirellulaceae bacterium]
MCPKGDEWQGAIRSRCRHGTECPYCTGRRVRKEE